MERTEPARLAGDCDFMCKFFLAISALRTRPLSSFKISSAKAASDDFEKLTKPMSCFRLASSNPTSPGEIEEMLVALRTAPSNPGAKRNMLSNSRSLKSSGNPIMKIVEMSEEVTEFVKIGLLIKLIEGCGCT